MITTRPGWRSLTGFFVFKNTKFMHRLLTLFLSAALMAPLHATEPVTVLEDFEDGMTKWKSPDHSLKPDSEHFHEGLSGARLHLVETALAYKTFEALDASEFAGVSFWVYSPAASDAVFGFALTSTPESGEGWSYFYVPITVDWEGWRQFFFRKEAFKTSRTPDWKTLTTISLSLSSWAWTKAAPEQFVTIDDIRLLTEEQMVRAEDGS